MLHFEGVRRPYVRALAVLTLAACLAACDTQGPQDTFVEEAGRPPSGITETTETGEILAEDPDDWRVAPAYGGQVRVDPAYPNPSPGGFVSIDVAVLGGGGIGGRLALRAYGAQGTFIGLADVPNQPGLYTLTFPTALLPRAGLHRLFLFDARAQLVSYGDLQLR